MILVALAIVASTLVGAFAERRYGEGAQRFTRRLIDFMVWVLLGPLAPEIARALHLTPAQKGLMVATLLFMAATLLYDIGYGNAQRPLWMTDSRTYPALSATSAALSKVIAERRAETPSAQADADKRAANAP